MLEFIDKFEQVKSQTTFIGDAVIELFPFPPGKDCLLEIIRFSQSRGIGQCMLVEMFRRRFLSKFPGTDMTTAEDAMQKYATDFFTAIQSLKLTVHLDSSGVVIYQQLQEALANAFDSDYLDPFELVPDYVRELRENMKKWVNSPLTFNAPYTSIFNASMTGKSRLIKEIAKKIPMVYICLRQYNDGYPEASPNIVTNIFKSPDYSSQATVESNEANIVLSFLAFFLSLLQHLKKWCKKYDAKDDTQREKLRKDLWLFLAEPQKSDDDRDEFWRKVSLDTRRLCDEKKHGPNELLKGIAREWHDLTPYFTFTVDGVSEPLLLFVWDEARVLVNTCMDGRPADSSLVSLFRLLRRPLRQMGRYGNPPVLRIFSLFTDTSSRIGNFQPRNDTDSSRAPIEPGSGVLMFRPIVLMPSLDAAARGMAITTNPRKVNRPSRLIRLGRVAWHLMKKKKTPVDLLDLAVSKLFRTARIALPSLFASEIRDDVKLKMLACLGPRLAIQTGPYVTATKELVASHMMTLERVGTNHDHLETRYLSEPILAEAAAQGTANHGWAKPLEALVSEMRHGIVDRGFRGEFITKVLLCMAVEDAQREVSKTSGSQKGWQFTQPITVQQFLNSLLRNPFPQEREISASAADIIFSASGKRILPTDDEAQITRKTKKLAKMSFDDSTSDDEEEVVIDNSDGQPATDNSFVDQFIKPEAEQFKIFGRKTPTPARENALKGLLHGQVFFNHFIRTETILRPSLLLKAWNRGAGIMTRNGATGVDFVIPVVMRGKLRGDLGPFIGSWSDKQEELAEGIIAYILIQTKSRTDVSPSDVRKALTRCIPITRKHKPYDPLPNFTKHNPTNPYISILMEFGLERRGEKRVQLMNVIDYAGLDEREEEITEKEKVVERLWKDESQSKKLEEAKKELQRLKDDREIELFWLPIREKQLSIVAYGLTQDTYKCLENRPNATRMLYELAQPYLNSLRGLSPNRAAALRAGRHVMIHPDREYCSRGN